MKKKLRSIFAIIGVLMISASLVVPSFALIRPITRHYQQKTNWCWVACAQMIGEYKNKLIPQKSICKSVKGTTNNYAATIEETAQALANATGKTCAYKASKLKFSTVQSQIDDRRPLIAGLALVDYRTNTFSGHAVVISGYSTKHNKKRIRIVDPAKLSKRQQKRGASGKHWVPYHNMVRFYSFTSGDGLWSETAYIKNGG